MATYFKMDEKEMLTLWLADKIPVDEDGLINYGSCSHVRKDYFFIKMYQSIILDVQYRYI